MLRMAHRKNILTLVFYLQHSLLLHYLHHTTHGTVRHGCLDLSSALAVIAADPALTADPALAQVEIDKVVW